LEIGPGLGQFAGQIAAFGYSYVGMDVSETLTRLMASKHRIVCASVPPLPVRPESIDIIVADQVLEHMPTYREALRLLQECRGSLKPSGWLVLGFPDFIRAGLDFHDGDYTHSFVTSENRVLQVLQDAGFHQPSNITRMTGSVTNPVARLALDLALLGINGSFASLVTHAAGLTPVIQQVRKSLAPSTFVVARKPPPTRPVRFRSESLRSASWAATS
jgi:SAM-dependent methyltransferase